MKTHVERFLVLFFGFVFLNCSTGLACSLAGATGSATTTGRPVIWKNRDSWSTVNSWKTFAFVHEPNQQELGIGPGFLNEFYYTGVTDLDSFDPAISQFVPWAGANEVGLALVQAGNHTLKRSAIPANEYPNYTEDEDGIDNGQLNHLILASCETIEDVQDLLEHTNDGGGWPNSIARYTTSTIMVFDHYGNMATFEIAPNDFTRDNVTTTYEQDIYDHYSANHDNDRFDAPPANGTYNGFDWRSNFSKVYYNNSVDDYPFFVDANNDGIHDWEYSTSSSRRYDRIGNRMDDDHLKDYQFMIQKKVEDGGINHGETIETLAKNIGYLPSENIQKSTGYHINRFVTTFSVVIEGSRMNDPYEGKLTTIWLAQGEPTVSVFIPIFPFSREVPDLLDNMYLHTNTKRHRVYNYISNDSGDYNEDRNIDHLIDTRVLAGYDPNTNERFYYGQGGLQKPVFQSEYWAYDRHESFMNNTRGSIYSDSVLRSKLSRWQHNTACYLKTAYVKGVSALKVVQSHQIPGCILALPVAD